MGLFSFFRNRGEDGSARLAKDRLQVLIAHERTDRNGPDYLPQLKQDILEVIKRYVKVGDESLTVQLETQADCDILELNITLPEDQPRSQQTPGGGIGPHARGAPARRRAAPHDGRGQGHLIPRPPRPRDGSRAAPSIPVSRAADPDDIAPLSPPVISGRRNRRGPTTFSARRPARVRSPQAFASPDRTGWAPPATHRGGAVDCCRKTTVRRAWSILAHAAPGASWRLSYTSPR